MKQIKKILACEPRRPKGRVAPPPQPVAADTDNRPRKEKEFETKPSGRIIIQKAASRGT